MDLSLAGPLPVAQFRPSPRQEFEAWILDRLWTDQRQHPQAERREISCRPGVRAAGTDQRDALRLKWPEP